MRIFGWKTLGALTVAAVLLSGGSARADFIYTSFGEPGDTHLTGSNVSAEAGPTSGSGLGSIRSAFSFTVGGTTDFTFAQARLAMWLGSGTNQITLELFATDTATGKPGTLLDSISVTNALTSAGSGSVVTFTSTMNPLLQHGDTYWLLPLASTDTQAAWFWNDQGQTGIGASTQTTTPTTTSDWGLNSIPLTIGAFDVSGTPAAPTAAPEPASLTLFGIGAVGMVGFARRRRLQAA
jgi:hypothetical protein